MQGRTLTPAKLGRALFLAVFAALLLAPPLTQIFFAADRQEDNRTLAPPPIAPHAMAEWLAWPKQLDAYLNDHFGLRRALVRANIFLHWHLLGESASSIVLIGRQGRLFFTGNTSAATGVLYNCGALGDDAARNGVAQEITTAMRRLMRQAPDLNIIMIPTSPVLYPETLPLWLARACQGRTPLPADLISRLPDDLKPRVFYPIEAANGLPPDMPLMPPQNFHWDGFAVKYFMEYVAAHILHLQPVINIERGPQLPHESDLSTLLPGLGLTNQVWSADLAKAQVGMCSDQPCVTAPPLQGMPMAGETWRLNRPGKGGKLLMLADSFGFLAGIALTEYYGDIFVLSMNQYQRLSDADKATLWHRLRRDWQPDRIMVLINDNNATALPRFMNMVPD